MDRAEHKECEEKTLPFACEMIVHSKTTMYNSGSRESRAINVSLELGLCILARVGEYLRSKSGEDHFFKAQDVVFIFSSPTKGAAPVYVSSHDVHLHTSHKDKLIGAIWTLRDAKNDSEGAGNNIPVDRNTSNGAAFDFVGDAFDWAVYERPLKDAPFVSTQDG